MDTARTTSRTRYSVPLHLCLILGLCTFVGSSCGLASAQEDEWWTRRPAPAVDAGPNTAPPTTEPASPTSDAGTAARPLKVVRGWPLLQVERGPGERREIDALFSLFNRESHGSDHHSTRLAPFYFARTDGPDEWSLLAPLYYQERSAEHSSFYSLPIAFGSSETASWLQAPFPLPIYSARSDTNTREDRLGLWPLVDIVGRHRHGDAASLDILGFGSWGRAGGSFLPVFRHRTDTDGNLLQSALFPVYHYRTWPRHASGDRDRLIVPFLGYLSDRDGDKTTRWWLPLLSRWEHDSEHHDAKILGGLIASIHEPDRDLLRFEPLFSHEKSATRTSWHALRLFGQEHDRATNYRATHVLPPLGLFSRSDHGYKHRMAPFYWAGGRNLDGEFASSYRVLAPFYFDRRTAHSGQKLLFPLYYHGYSPEAEQRVVFPLYWQGQRGDREHLHAFPFYSHVRNGHDQTDAFLGNLYVREESTTAAQGTRVSRSLFWPLFNYTSGPDYRHSHAAPLWWSTRDGDDEFNLLAPLYLRTRSGSRSQHWLLPLYGHTAGMDTSGNWTRRSFFAGGSVIHTRSESHSAKIGVEDRWHVLGPIAGWSRNDTRQTSHSRALPIWWQDKSPTRSTTLLFPAYFNRTKRDDQGADASSLTCVLGNLWVDHRTPEKRESGLLYPLTRYKARVAQSASGTEVLSSRLDVLGLYSSKQRAQARSWRLSPLLHVASNRAPDGVVDDDPQWWHIWSRRHDSTGTRTRLMPFLFSHDQRETTTRTTALAGLLAREERPDRSMRRALPFYYSSRHYAESRTLESSTTSFFPLYMHQMRYQGDWNKTSLLFPLYSREVWGRRQPASTTHTALAGIGRWYRSEQETASRLFPIYSAQWRDNGESDLSLALLYRRRVASPQQEVKSVFSRDGYAGLQLYRDAVGTNTRTTVVNPLLFGYHRDDRREHVSWNFLHFNRYRRDRDTSSYTVAGLIRGNTDAHWEWDSVFPLYFSAKYNETKIPRFSLPGLLHLYSRHEDRDESHWSLLGVLASGSSKGDGDYSFRILHKGAAFLKQDGYTERTIQPLVTYEHDASSGYRYFSLLKILYSSSQVSAAEPVTRRVLGIPLSW